MKSFGVSVFHFPGDEYGNWYMKKERYLSATGVVEGALQSFNIPLEDTDREEIQRLDSRRRITHITLAVCPEKETYTFVTCSIFDQFVRKFGFYLACDRLSKKLLTHVDELKDTKRAYYHKRNLIFLTKDEIRSMKHDTNLSEVILGGDTSGNVKALKKIHAVRKAGN